MKALVIIGDAFKMFETSYGIWNTWNMIVLAHEGIQFWVKGFIVRTCANLKLACQDVHNIPIVDIMKAMFLSINSLIIVCFV
jgi:hypothetical protein